MHHLKKHTKYVLSVLVVVLCVYGFSCTSSLVCGNQYIDRIVRESGIIIAPQGSVVVEVVDTVESREQGLSGRETLGEGKGMFFVFETAGRYGFWMKDMNFPIDIIWINEEGVVVYEAENVLPESYPTSFINQADAKYVLELTSGQARKLGIYLGVKLALPVQD